MTTTTKTELHPQPGWSVIATEQLLAVGVAVRREAALVFGLLAGLFLVVLISEGRPMTSLGVPFVPEIGIPAALVAALAPWAVWKTETPERRSFLWSLPLARGPHQFLKIVAGWFWVMVALGLYMLIVFLLALATRGEIGTWTLRLPTNPDDFSGTLWTTQEFRTPSWEWLVPFTAATTTYFLGSILMVGSNHPIRWLMGIGIISFALTAIAESPHSALRPYFSQIVLDDSAIGFQNVLSPKVPEGAFQLRAGPSEDAVTIDYPYGYRPSPTRWLAATGLWLGIALAGSLFVSFRHREP